jgi:hypothetical protein
MMMLHDRAAIRARRCHRTLTPKQQKGYLTPPLKAAEAAVFGNFFR